MNTSAAPSAAVRAPGTLALAAALLSAAGIVIQLQVTRMLSAVTLYHFAFLSISVALCGLGAGALRARKLYSAAGPDESLRLAARHAYLMTLIAFLGLFEILLVPFNIPDAPLLAVTGIAMTLTVITAYFLHGGIALSLVLWKFPASFHRLYGYDLLGGALAGPALVGLYYIAPDGPAVWLIGTLVAWLAGWCLERSAGGPVRQGSLRWIGLLPLAFLVLQLWAVALGSTLFPTLFFQGLRSPGRQFETWNFFSRVAVYHRLEEAQGWGFPRGYKVAPEAKQYSMVIDALAGTYLVKNSGDPKEVEHLKFDITNFAHYLRPGSNVVVIGVGGGRDVLASTVFGQKSTLGVEINPGVLKATNGRFAEWTGHLDKIPGVSFVVDEARSYLERNRISPDMIVISMIDTWAANAAGAYVLTENSLYTVESWRTMLERLTKGGVLTVSRWYVPQLPAELYRLMTLAGTVLRDRGITNPREHVIVVGVEREDTHAITTMIVSPSPFSAADVALAKSKANELGFKIVFSPEGSDDPLYEQLLKNPDDTRLLDSVALDVSAPTDDRPYFFQKLRFLDSFLGNKQLQGAMQLNIEANTLLANTCMIVIIIAVALLLPAVRETAIRGAPALVLSRVLYFGALGFGFMFIEFALLQRFNLILGHPFFAMVVILSGLLAASGVGSMWWMGSPGRRALLPWVALAACVLFLVSASILPRLLAEQGQALRVVSTLLVTLAVGFPLGGMMANGLSTLRNPDDELPLCWATNGFASVVGSVLSVVVSMFAGITWTTILGIACYAIAAVSLFPLRSLR